MKKFDVTITEKLERVVTVEAEDLAEAEEIVESDWNSGKHILDADDFVGAEFRAKEVVF